MFLLGFSVGRSGVLRELWRFLTYLKWQPMRLPSGSTPRAEG